MMSACLSAPRRFEAVGVERLEPGPSEVRVRLRGCGVCASNIPLWEGRTWFQYPWPAGSPGHEGWGNIDALGKCVVGLAPDDPVTLLSSRAFSQYDIAPADCVVRLPRQLWGRPFLGEPLACAMNIFARAAIEPGQDVSVVGAGFLGLLLIQLISEAGARVVAISRRHSSLSLAKRYGAREIVQISDESAEAAQRIAGAKGFERVIEAAGSQQALDIASALIGEHGRLVIASYHQDGLREVNLQQWNWRGIDVINAHERQPSVYIEGMRRAIQAVCEGRLDPWPLLTHRFPLSCINDACEIMVQRPDGFVKALVET
jgi:threonine dehydrogenase-like Zn-dependent dehydrogenase